MIAALGARRSAAVASKRADKALSKMVVVKAQAARMAGADG